MLVLLVDDSGTMREIQRKCLKQLGIDDVVEARDGLQALELFDQQEFHIVLSDLNMPVMDGLTFLKEVRRRNKSVPVVIVTTESERSHVVAAIQAGCSDYVVKPFSPITLQEKLRKWIDQLSLTRA